MRQLGIVTLTVLRVGGVGESKRVLGSSATSTTAVPTKQADSTRIMKITLGRKGDFSLVLYSLPMTLTAIDFVNSRTTA